MNLNRKWGKNCNQFEADFYNQKLQANCDVCNNVIIRHVFELWCKNMLLDENKFSQHGARTCLFSHHGARTCSCTCCESKFSRHGARTCSRTMTQGWTYMFPRMAAKNSRKHIFTHHLFPFFETDKMYCFGGFLRQNLLLTSQHRAQE